MSTSTNVVGSLSHAEQVRGVLSRLGVAGDPRLTGRGGATHTVTSPATGEALATITLDTAAGYEAAVARATKGFAAWREVPAPERGQVVRAIGEELRVHKTDLGLLVSLEVGKILQEGLGEVQETIDIADFAVGLSRQLYGLTMPSERAQHRMFEQWLPLGPIGIITAFNFPNAVWGWNAMLAAVCGDTSVWKPSLLAPLTAIATNAIADRVARRMGHEGVFELVIGTDAEVGERLVADRRLPLISATGSCRMGRIVGEAVAKRLGRCLLELGGNNAVILDGSANLDLAAPAILFAAVGTAGQRCTTTRRLIAHESIVEDALARLTRAYGRVRIGDPTAEGTLVGPLVTPGAVDGFLKAIARAKAEGGTIVCGGGRATVAGACAAGNFVEPTIVRAPEPGAAVRGEARAKWYAERFAISCEETFAPILYVMTYRDVDEAIAINNAVDQGLSSAIMTDSMRNAERFLSPAGSDCGIANVNIGTSGAEIGGAFGGEKDTGGGRESGSDSWKAYMRRQTCTINHGTALRLAQGIRFD
jgi:aldehyde dehydrogenase (NAD+)